MKVTKEVKIHLKKFCDFERKKKAKLHYTLVPIGQETGWAPQPV
jgi:hypothetical protein